MSKSFTCKNDDSYSDSVVMCTCP